MTKRTAFQHFVVVLAALGLASLACTGLIASRGQPTVTILSPEPGVSVVVGEAVPVRATATDPGGPGVVRLDLLVDGVVVDTFEGPGPSANLSAELTFTPNDEGALSVSVIAYRRDGTGSPPATMALTAVGEPDGEEVAAQEGSQGDTAEVGDTASGVSARASTTANIRANPGPTCQLIGSVPNGGEFTLLAVTDRPSDNWYLTDYLGEDHQGWVWSGNLTLLGDDGELKRLTLSGCSHCGDGTCSASYDETCSTCPSDCGACPTCGDGTCDEGIGENCETCEADCGLCETCGDGICQPHESAEWCGDCEEEEIVAAVCGNGEVEEGEACDGDASCPGSSSCAPDCSSCMLDVPPVFPPCIGEGCEEDDGDGDGDDGGGCCDPGVFCPPLHSCNASCQCVSDLGP